MLITILVRADLVLLQVGLYKLRKRLDKVVFEIGYLYACNHATNLVGAAIKSQVRPSPLASFVLNAKLVCRASEKLRITAPVKLESSILIK